MKSARFIAVEGVEGVGKSTNIALIADLIRAAGHDVLLTREPGGTPLGERVRDILLDKEASEMTGMTELLLLFAARAQHVETVIKPALAAGTWVITDRFTDSSFAYQGGGRELGATTVAEVERVVLGDFRPDLVMLLDVDVATGLLRAAEVGEADRFESEEMAFFERVRRAFLARAAADERYLIVDTSQAIGDVQAEIRATLTDLLK